MTTTEILLYILHLQLFDFFPLEFTDLCYSDVENIAFFKWYRSMLACDMAYIMYTLLA